MFTSPQRKYIIEEEGRNGGRKFRKGGKIEGGKDIRGKENKESKWKWKRKENGSRGWRRVR